MDSVPWADVFYLFFYILDGVPYEVFVWDSRGLLRGAVWVFSSVAGGQSSPPAGRLAAVPSSLPAPPSMPLATDTGGGGACRDGAGRGRGRG